MLGLGLTLNQPAIRDLYIPPGPSSLGGFQDFTVTGAALTPDNPAFRRYIRPTPAGTADGSSWANAAPLTSLPTLVTAAGNDGGKIYVRADEGPYSTLLTFIQLNSGSVSIEGVDVNLDPMLVEIQGGRDVWTQPVDPEEITDVRTFTYAGLGIFRLAGGANGLQFKDIGFKHCGSCIRIVAPISNLTIDGCDAYNVQRYIDTSFSSPSTYDQLANATIKNSNIVGFSKTGLRILGGSNNILIDTLVLDSARQDGDNFAMAMTLGDTTEQLAVRGRYVHDIHIINTTTKNCHDEILNYGLPDTYYNGDGISAEESVYNLKIEGCISTGHTDGGYDLKSANTLIKECNLSDNKRNLRLWGVANGDIDVVDTIFGDSNWRGGSGGAAAVHLAQDADVLLQGCTINDTNTQANTVGYLCDEAGSILRVFDTTESFGSGVPRTAFAAGSYVVDLSQGEWDATDIPTIVETGTYTVNEGETLAPFALTATEANATFRSIGGDKHWLDFTLEGTSTFGPKDFEFPLDLDENNVYTTTVRVRDKRRNESTKVFSVTILDVGGEIVSTERWISPTPAGLRNGVDLANAAALNTIDDIIGLLAPGSTLKIVAGTYTLPSSRTSITRGGTAGNRITIRGVKADGTDLGVGEAWPGILRGNRKVWTGVAEFAAPADPETIYDAEGWNGQGAFIFESAAASHLEWKDLRFSRVGYAFQWDADGINDVHFERIAMWNVQRGFESSQVGTQVDALGDPLRRTVFDISYKFISILGHSKQAFRTAGTSHDILFEDCDINSGRQDKDNFAVGFYTGNYAYDIIHRRCISRNITDTTGSYQNGDGFSTEETNHNIFYYFCESYDHTDGGWDCKGTDIVYEDCIASGNKRNYRHWGRGANLRGLHTFRRCESTQPKHRDSDSAMLHFHQAMCADAILDDCTITDSGIAGDTTVTTAPNVKQLYTFGSSTWGSGINNINPSILRLGNNCTESCAPTARTSFTTGQIFYDGVDLTDVTPPTITSNLAPSVPEAEAFDYTLTANETVIFFVTGGADAAQFTTNATNIYYNLTTLQLAAKDFETPEDADGDGVFEIEITAVDRARNSTAVTLEFTIADVDELLPAAQTTALLAEMDTQPSAAHAALIDTFIKTLKVDGTWSAIKMCRILAGQDAQAAGLDWKNPTAPDITLVSAPTFTPYEGYTFNGTSSYIDTNQTWAGLGVTNQSMHQFVWSKTDLSNGGYDVGHATGGNRTFINGRNADGNLNYNAAGSASPTVAVADSLGFYGFVRNGSSTGFVRKGLTTVSTDVGGSAGTLSTADITIGRGNSTYSSRQIAAVICGTLLTEAQATTLYNALDDYFTGLLNVVPAFFSSTWRTGYTNGLSTSDINAPGTVIADFAVTANGPATFTEVADASNKFTVSGTTLVLSDSINDGASASVTVRCTRTSNGAYTEETLTFTAAASANETETDTLVAAMTSAPDATRIEHIDDLIKALKVDSTIWAAIKSMRVWAAGNAHDAQLNWKNPGATAVTIVSAPVFTADRGYTFDGVDDAINTGASYATLGLTNVDLSQFVWVLTDTQTAGHDLGAMSGGGRAHICSRDLSGNLEYNDGGSANASIAVPTSVGFSATGRTASNSRWVQKNGVTVVSGTGTGASTLATGNLAIGRGSSAGLFSNRQIAVSIFATYLTPTQATTVYNAIRTYLIAVGAVAP